MIASQTSLSWYWLWHPLVGPGYQFWSGIGSDISEVTLVGTFIGGILMGYRHIECQQEGCHRLGRFSHGHYKLCHVHHPHAPSDGKINQTHIDEIDKEMMNRWR
jgi:hypothetical protein